MKTGIIVLHLILSVFVTTAQSESNSGELWDIKFYSIDSFQIHLKSYKDKPLVLVAIDASNPDRIQLSILDSLNKNPHGNVRVIGLLLNDFGPPQPEDSILKTIREGRGLSFPITRITKGKRGPGIDDRLQLLKWLNENTKAKHFKIDFNEPGQMFVISTNGVLYAVLSKTTLLSDNAMEELLSRSPDN